MNVINFENQYCKKIRAYMDSYLSNELLIETNHEVLKHLESCDSCSAELESRERAKRLLQRAGRQGEAPPGLEEKIRRRIRETESKKRGQWMLAAAAALALFVGTWGVLQWRGANIPSDESDMARSERNARILEIGLGDHIHCALDAGFSKKRFSPDQMTQALGQEYAGIVSLVNDRAPGDYEITAGHRCKYKGRRFVHLMLAKEEAVLSLVITRKDGEAFSNDSLTAITEAAGGPVHRARLQDFEVTGFETRDHLAFVVSDLDREKNLLVASSLAPSLRGFLAGLETRS